MYMKPCRPAVECIEQHIYYKTDKETTYNLDQPSYLTLHLPWNNNVELVDNQSLISLYIKQQSGWRCLNITEGRYIIVLAGNINMHIMNQMAWLKNAYLVGFGMFQIAP